MYTRREEEREGREVGRGRRKRKRGREEEGDGGREREIEKGRAGGKEGKR